MGEGRSDISVLLHKLTSHRLRTGNFTSLPKFDLGPFIDSFIDDFLGDALDEYRVWARGSKSWPNQAEYVVERDPYSDGHWRAYGDRWNLR